MNIKKTKSEKMNGVAKFFLWFAISPLISLFSAVLLASLFDIRLTEAGAPPGAFGNLLYAMMILGWGIGFTVPIAVIGYAVYLTYKHFNPKQNDDPGPDF